MEVVTTIVPIFVVILLGWVARRRGFISDDFLDPANRLVYCLSIPALIFGSIAKTSFYQQFDGKVVFLTLLAIIMMYLSALFIARMSQMTTGRTGAFVLTSAHSNVGYIGLPIAYYYLSVDEFASASIVCGFVMIGQNLMSVLFLQMQQISHRKVSSLKATIKALSANPVIIGALAGMLVSLLEINLPQVVWRTVDILGGLAPPMALLLIGASLSLQLARNSLPATFGAITIKLLILPATAVVLFRLFHVKPVDYLPAVILLASPAATIIYVMVKGMHYDADFAVTQISLGTLFSAVTFIVWLAVIPRMFVGN
jgi:malate permease and related proteins